MNALVFVDTKQMLVSAGEGKGLDMPKPFAKDIFLTEFLVAGNIFGLKTNTESLVEGTKLKLFRDKKNRYDRNSIVIKDDSDNRIGFVPVAKNEILARLLEAGKAMYAKITKSHSFSDGSLELTVGIYLEG